MTFSHDAVGKLNPTRPIVVRLDALADGEMILLPEGELNKKIRHRPHGSANTSIESLNST
jgi:hypothetical protein